MPQEIDDEKDNPSNARLKHAKIRSKSKPSDEELHDPIELGAY